MTPATARELLYNEIVPVAAVQREHDQVRRVLSLVAETLELEDSLRSVAASLEGRNRIAELLAVGNIETLRRLQERWSEASPEAVVRDCVLGFKRVPRRLQDLVAGDRYETPPLPNLYFTRDAGFVVHHRAYRSAMASPVRSAEAALTAAVLESLGFPVDQTLAFADGADTKTSSAAAAKENAGTGRLGDPGAFKVEGGDVLVLGDDLVLIGLGERSSAAGIDALLQAMGHNRDKAFTAVVVQLPTERATIHLDMVATVIDHGVLLAYEPLVGGSAVAPVFEVTIPAGGGEWTIREHGNLMRALGALGRPHDIVACGGKDPVTRQREQWFSACNSVALAPGVIVAYQNNPATLDALSSAGFSVLSGDEVLADPRLLVQDSGELQSGRIAVAVPGVELARGGGGPRCMTLPIEREEER